MYFKHGISSLIFFLKSEDLKQIKPKKSIWTFLHEYYSKNIRSLEFKLAPKIFSLAPLMLFGTNKPIPEMEYFPKRNFGKQGEMASINHCIFL